MTTIFIVFIILIQYFIVFVWAQYDGGNIGKEQLAEVPSKTLRSQAEYYGRRLILDPTNESLIQPFTI